jgi:biofilm PGA synthesis N-glycosyltransferase PgaC
MRILALIPAHNEEQWVSGAVASLLHQTTPPSAIFVIADNCSDRTAVLAEAAGARVISTVGNVTKKAGTLNQALTQLLDDYDDDDVVVAMDADSTIGPDWIENGLRHLAKGSADAVGAACLVVKRKGVLPLIQDVEYVMQRRLVSRRNGRVEVLSGAGTLIPVGLLRHVARARGTELPGKPGEIYDGSNITEDFELTMALKKLGYQVRSFKDMVVTTDVMTTVRSLAAQRARWQRGTLETLWRYRRTRAGLKGWATQAMIYSFSLVTPLAIVLWVELLLHMHHALHVQWLWLGVIPFFMADQLLQAWRSGAKGRLLAVAVIPMWIYNTLHSLIYWYVLARYVARANVRWQ